ncbi:MAG: riboflavin synthase [Pseudonocardiales bacterium]|jgi:riboflavin synthase|nr:riboflavin synthase [Pseudonocardiales bacterium]MDT7608076.1 riboflavin synthase [Pseudonocardiales bacterium]MDT7641119.1 riboflavin synthase [Pseudonocardiales bacterium]MDT7666121.1 riboflavin synthase [Pseudonocardiales bacterium]MDT7670522.1 riboflavin synthase [Pseudonocardiales bacterium]
MFTGIVEEVGEVREVREQDDVVRLVISGPVVASDTRHGDSIAVNGVCLTAVEVDGADFSVELVPETLRRSSLAGVATGARVNLERAMSNGQRFGGHIMQGHVDGTATVMSHTPGERTAEIRFRLGDGLARYVVEKGSIAVDGVSLTVASVDRDSFSVALIPTTLADTTLGVRQSGDRVNIEVDVLAKYVERLVSGYLPGPVGQAPPEAVEPVEEGGARSW